MYNNESMERTPQLAEFLHKWRNHTQTSFEAIYNHCHIRQSTFTLVQKRGFHPSLTPQHVCNMACYLSSLLDSEEEVEQLARDLGYALMGEPRRQP